MKKYNIILLSSLVVVVLFSVSCKKSFFTDANINPNAPPTVTETYILGPVETSIAYAIGGDMSRFTSIITQQTFGFSRQSAAYQTYIFTEQDFDNLWALLYENCMYNTDTLISQADKNGNNAYAGIGRMLLAYTLQMTVDMWGDIPYSQAFQGLQNLTPTFDKGQDVYNNILLLVDAGIANLNNAEPGVLLPGAEDNIYGGDPAKWILFGHAIKARIYIHQSKNNPAMAQAALDEANQSFTSNADNATFAFGITETNANPIYQFNEQRADIAFDISTLADTLLADNDPRYSVYVNPDFTDINGVGLGDFFGSINSGVDLITYDEMEFVKAEASLRSTSDFTNADSAYRNAIRANFQKYAIDDSSTSAYVSANPISTTSADASLATIGVQEWIALYLNPEEFTTWRRLNSPNLESQGNSAIPRRFLYPQAERSYNGANAPQATLLTPLIFWDTP
ncbi:MAG: SusD/RagB family nutrient-binding outer membrane lipoprotein [Chitinophagales bacterium]|nr:SusD/RagB family nutrient-binding outer membrane lipoprotein [Chitinophagales bacterium]